MAATRGKWIGWWIVTGALLALVVFAVGCNGGDPSSPSGDEVVDEPVPPPFPGATTGSGTGQPPAQPPQTAQTDQTRPTGATGSGTAGVAPRDVPDNTTPGAPAVGRSTSPTDVLRELERAQAAFVRANHVDEDFDGTGEYGGLAELSRAVGGRMGRPIREPLIRRELGQLNARGEGRLGDYLYRLWLPGRFGLGIGELWGGAGTAQFEPNLAEDYWSCYAWPARGVSGPTYFISQDGRLLATDDPRYVGSGNGPQAGAALRRGEIEDMLAPPATNATGLDGNTWRTAR